MVIYGCLPSGNDQQFAIENGPVEIVDLPIENGGSFHSYVSLPEGNYPYGYNEHFMERTSILTRKDIISIWL